MEATETHSPDTIQQAATALKRIRPAYAQIVDYHAQLFSEQEKAQQGLDLHLENVTLPEIDPSVGRGFAVLDLRQWPINLPATQALMVAICDLTLQAGLKTADSAQHLKTALAQGKVDIGALVAGYLAQDGACLEDQGAELQVAPEFIHFAVYQGMLPSIRVCAEYLQTHLEKSPSLKQPACPICGSAPALALYSRDGQRHVFCGFCWHLWPMKRVYCPFCQNKNNTSLQYLYLEEEKEYRVDVCDQCRKYLKSIDLRQTERVIYPRLEHAATVHLDLKAQQAGYGV